MCGSSIGHLHLGRNISYPSTEPPFQSNKLLISLTIGEDVTVISANCFSGCIGLTGTLLMSQNNFNEKISVSALSQGVYLLKVYTDKTDKGVAISKIVKE